MCRNNIIFEILFLTFIFSFFLFFSSEQISRLDGNDVTPIRLEMTSSVRRGNIEIESDGDNFPLALSDVIKKSISQAWRVNLNCYLKVLSYYRYEYTSDLPESEFCESGRLLVYTTTQWLLFSVSNSFKVLNTFTVSTVYYNI